MKQRLLDKIAEREITVGVIGLGYVGLPLAVEKAKAGFKTIGFDEQLAKVEMVNQGHNYIGDVVDKDLKKLVDEGLLSATSDFAFIKDVDFIAICVPTPLDIHQEPDLSCVRDSTAEIAKHLKKKYDGGAGVHHLSGDDGRAGPPDSGEGFRPSVRGGFLSRIFTGACGPGQPDL